MAVYARIRTEIPGAKIIVMAIFPREKDPASPRRALINEVNEELEPLMKRMQVTFINIAPKMLNPDGTFQTGMMLDFTHPTDTGYQVWADAICPYIEGKIK
jgi:lysophospholipase L1-like esterase